MKSRGGKDCVSIDSKYLTNLCCDLIVTPYLINSKCNFFFVSFFCSYVFLNCNESTHLGIICPTYSEKLQCGVGIESFVWVPVTQKAAYHQPRATLSGLKK